LAHAAQQARAGEVVRQAVGVEVAGVQAVEQPGVQRL